MGKIKRTVTEVWTVEPDDDEDLLVELACGAGLTGMLESNPSDDGEAREPPPDSGAYELAPTAPAPVEEVGEVGYEEDGDSNDLDS